MALSFDNILDITVRKRISSVKECVEDKQDIEYPLYIIKFSKDANPLTIEWITNLLEKEQSLGGAELLVKKSETINKEILLEIRASPLRLLEGAEILEILKEDKYGKKCEFVLSSVDLFLKPDEDLNDLLTVSEKQRIILNEIMALHSAEKIPIVGYPNMSLYPGQSVVQVCRNKKIIQQIFPLHDKKELVEIIMSMSKFSYSTKTLGAIQRYFGDALAFYFAFLGFYTMALIPPSIIGLVQLNLTLDVTYSYIIFSIFKMIWLTLFLELWKRRSSELSFIFGTLKNVSLPKLHPTFRGTTLGEDPVTNQLVPVYPSYKKYFKVYLISTPVVFVCTLFAIYVMLVYFYFEDYISKEYYEDESIVYGVLIQIPGIIYSIVVVIMSKLFRKLAKVLTEWENHRTQQSYENHLVTRLILFEFINNFVSMFYLAFYVNDFKLLKSQIGFMMVIYQALNQFQEAVLPILLQKFDKWWRKPNYSALPEPERTIAFENELLCYSVMCTYDDYLEIFIQFGYVFLFSSIYPEGAILALMNNLVEIWADSFKLCTAYQRPQAQSANGIGAWLLAFEILGVLSVMTNCALICLSPEVSSHASDIDINIFMLGAVTIEHIIIAIKIILAYLISDVPKWVKVQIQKQQYESSQALKSERRLKMKEVLKSMKEKNE